MINFERTLEVAGNSGFIQPINLVQYDDTLPVGVFEFTENGQPFDIPDGAKAKVRMRKADGKGVYNDAVISGDTVQVVFTQQMTAAFGVGFLNIELSYDGGVKSSEPVQVVVLENAVQQGAIESSDEFLTLDEIVKQVETLRQQTATDAAAASASKTAAASSATAAQAARQGAEAAESRVNAIVAGNESYTKRQSRNLFARALKAETDKAASLEIYPDEGSNIVVTAYGFTEQAGSGDASPNNVREITVGGLQANLLNHHITSKNVNGVVATKNTDGTITFTGTAAAGAWFNLWNAYQPAITGKLYFSGFTAGFTRCYVYFDKGTTNVDYKMFEDTGNGVSFNASSDFTRMQISVYIPQGTTMNATVGFVLARAKTPYTPYTGAKYGTVVKTKGISEINKLIPLKEPLCEGDTIETRVKSGCDVEVEFDGSDDENWTLSGGKAEGYTKIFIPPTFSLQKDTTMLSPWLAQEPLTSWVQNVGREYIATDGVNLLVCVKTSTTHSMSEARAILKSKPLKMFIKSTAYAEENDVRVCRETHLKRKYHLKISDMNNAEDYPGWKIPELSSIVGSGKNGSIPGTVSSVGNNSTFCNTNVAVGQIFFYTSHWGGLNQSQIKEQYPNLEIDVVLPRAKPLVYAYDPIYIEGYPDGNGKFIVSGEKLISAKYNKSLNREFEEFKAAMLAMGANFSL